MLQVTASAMKSNSRSFLDGGLGGTGVGVGGMTIMTPSSIMNMPASMTM